MRFAVLLGVLALLAATLAGCAHRPADGAAQDQGNVALQSENRAARQILVTARQPQAAALALVGDPGLSYQRRRGYGPAPDVERLLDALASDYGLERVEGWLITSLGIYCEVYELAPGQNAAELIARVGADPRVESAQAMNVFATQGVHYNDPYAGLQPALADLSLDAAHERATGRGVRVAVVDSAVDNRHPEIRGRVSVRREFAAAHRPAGRAEVHGTATAGIIASAANNAEGIVGVAPEAEIVGLRACWTVDERTGRALCSSLSLAQALEAAIALGVDVVNLSLAGPQDPLLARLVDRALADGMIVVAALPDGAGGNRDDDSTRGDASGIDSAGGSGLDFPASHPGVIAVVATGTTGTTGTTGATGATGTADATGTSGAVVHGPPNLLFAPGSEVLSTVPDAGYGFFSGNSMSAAFVAGVAALLVEREPGIDAVRALARLAASASGGSINACRAVAGPAPGDACAALSADPPLAALSQRPR